MTEVLLGGSLLPLHAPQLWAGTLAWSWPGQAGKNARRDSSPQPQLDANPSKSGRPLLPAGTHPVTSLQLLQTLPARAGGESTCPATAGIYSRTAKGTNLSQ